MKKCKKIPGKVGDITHIESPLGQFFVHRARHQKSVLLIGTATFNRVLTIIVKAAYLRTRITIHYAPFPEDR